jgi:hypothetical protein
MDWGLSTCRLPTGLAERGSDALHLIMAGKERLQLAAKVGVRRQQLALIE